MSRRQLESRPDDKVVKVMKVTAGLLQFLNVYWGRNETSRMPQRQRENDLKRELIEMIPIRCS